MIILTSGSLTVSIVPLGASLAGVWHDTVPNSLVLGSPDAAAYGKLPYWGAVIGPIANRIGGATVRINDIPYQMPQNEGTTCLHSGDAGLHAQIWDTLAQTGTMVRLRCKMPDGACGLPGNREFGATYQVLDAGVLRLHLTATSDADTLVNLAHHPYWNLDGAQTIAAHQLCAPAPEYTPITPQTLPTGEIIPTAETAYDFRVLSPIPLDKTLDANLCYSKERTDTPRLMATLSSPSGITLRIHSTEAGLQVYNGTGLEPIDVPLHDDRALRRCAGIALEPQSWPDAPNHASFPQITLLKDQTYQQITEYHISR